MDNRFVQSDDLQERLVDEVAETMQLVTVHGVGKPEMPEIPFGTLHKEKSQVLVAARFLKFRPESILAEFGDKKAGIGDNEFAVMHGAPHM